MCSFNVSAYYIHIYNEASTPFISVSPIVMLQILGYQCLLRPCVHRPPLEYLGIPLSPEYKAIITFGAGPGGLLKSLLALLQGTSSWGLNLFSVVWVGKLAQVTARNCDFLH